MGILISNAAMSTTMASARNSDLPATLSITYAAVRTNQPGVTYLENGVSLVAYLRSQGWPSGRELRVQWAPSPPAPAATVTEVRNAIAQLSGGLGARAYASGNELAFGTNPENHLMGHEATHVVQSGGHGQRNVVSDGTIDDILGRLNR